MRFAFDALSLEFLDIYLEWLSMIEAEVLNQIAAKMEDLATRLIDIRGYL